MSCEQLIADSNTIVLRAALQKLWNSSACNAKVTIKLSSSGEHEVQVWHLPFIPSASKAAYGTSTAIRPAALADTPTITRSEADTPLFKVIEHPSVGIGQCQSLPRFSARRGCRSYGRQGGRWSHPNRWPPTPLAAIALSGIWWQLLPRGASGIRRSRWRGLGQVPRLSHEQLHSSEETENRQPMPLL